MAIPLRTLWIFAAIAGCSGVSGYEFRSEKMFANEIDGHLCRKLFVGGREIAWVARNVETSVGLIVRLCEESVPTSDSPTGRDEVEGGVREGWSVVDLRDGTVRRLSLPGLGDFSNPSFCDGRAAYWAEVEGDSWALVVADLSSGAVLGSVPLGRLDLATDYMYALPQAAWSRDCRVARFEDERYLPVAGIELEIEQ